MEAEKQSWLKRTCHYLRNTIAPLDTGDSKFVRFQKNLGFGVFLALLICGTLAILVAASFMH
jgi:hypothetical protein